MTAKNLSIMCVAAVFLLALGTAPALAGCGSCPGDKDAKKKAAHSHAKGGGECTTKCTADKAKLCTTSKKASTCTKSATGEKASKCTKCSLTSSHAHVGKPAPTFALKDHAGKTVDLAKLTAQKKIVVLEWFNPDCPFVKKHHHHSKTMAELEKKYRGKNVVWLAINSSHYADQKFNAKWAKKWNLAYPVLNDKHGKVGKMYKATTTPNMYIIDAKGTLVYAGAIDSHRGPRVPGSSEKVVNYVDQALTALLAGKPITVSQTKPYGCSVKYGTPKKDKPAKSAAMPNKDTLACDWSRAIDYP